MQTNQTKLTQHNKRYRYFNTYCLRTPLFPFAYFDTLTASTTITTQQLKSLWRDTVVQEAIFLAAPTLYEELKKWADNIVSTNTNKIEYTFIKYLSRMATRCTPFGLFAGCTIGHLAATSHILLKPQTQFNRNTDFDMNLLVSLALQLANVPEIKKELYYYPNSSLYQAGNHLRYVEYSYRNNKRLHDIQAVTASTYLKKILAAAQSGKLLAELASLIVDDTITLKDATAFIQELVDNQLLVSELEPSVSGESFLWQIQNTLAKVQKKPLIVDKIQTLDAALQKLDCKLGNAIQDYKILRKQIQEIPISFENKYLFQTDLYLTTSYNQLAQSTFDTVKKGIAFLNKITPKKTTSKLAVFRKAFVSRYEQEEVPLALALDIEMGIGYPVSSSTADDATLIADLKIAKKPPKAETIAWDKTREILSSLLQQSTAKQQYSLTLKDSDFSGFDEDWSDLPDTFSCIAELLRIEGEELIYLNSSSGATASNLLGRFAGGDQATQDYVQRIIATEDALNNQVIRAEIIHLPEARTGNILKRTASRKFEIPYLAQSHSEQQLPLADLMLSVKGNRIVLRSKKWNKEVLPQLSNAHNYSNSLPIYQFLCDMQGQNLRTSLYFSWGNAAKGYTFLPRVYYGSIILSKATWMLTQESISPFYKLLDQPQKLLATIAIWRKQQRLPKYIQLVERDNTLLINLTNATSIAVLLNTVQKKQKFVLEEFLFTDEGLVHSPSGYYTNQVVFSFHKAKNSI